MFLTTTKQVLRIRLLKPAAPAHHTSTIMQITTTYECGRSSHSKTGSPSFSMWSQRLSSYASQFPDVKLGKRSPLCFETGSDMESETFKSTKKETLYLEKLGKRTVSVICSFQSDPTNSKQISIWKRLPLLARSWRSSSTARDLTWASLVSLRREALQVVSTRSLKRWRV